MHIVCAWFCIEAHTVLTHRGLHEQDRSCGARLGTACPPRCGRQCMRGQNRPGSGGAIAPEGRRDSPARPGSGGAIALEGQRDRPARPSARRSNGMWHLRIPRLVRRRMAMQRASRRRDFSEQHANLCWRRRVLPRGLLDFSSARGRLGRVFVRTRGWNPPLRVRRSPKSRRACVCLGEIQVANPTSLRCPSLSDERADASNERTVDGVLAHQRFRPIVTPTTSLPNCGVANHEGPLADLVRPPTISSLPVASDIKTIPRPRA